MEGGFRLRSPTTLPWVLSVCLFSLMVTGDGTTDFRHKFCDERHSFAPSEDQSFVEMLDKLLEDSRAGFSGAEVTVKDTYGRFEGKAGCLWHNCQIYDGECYDCHSTKDAEACIETVIAQIKQGLQEGDRDVGEYCHRTRRFASGEKAVAVDDASTTFQVCGVQYRYLGNLAAFTRSAF